MVDIKSKVDIEKMRIAGKLASEVLEMIGQYVKPGVSTEELDQICHDYIVKEQNAIPAPLNYKGFPKSICTSVNHQVCHGIPSDDKILKESDIINIDVTVIKEGFHGDTSKMYHVGKPSILSERLCKITQECMYKAIDIVNNNIIDNYFIPNTITFKSNSMNDAISEYYIDFNGAVKGDYKLSLTITSTDGSIVNTLPTNTELLFSVFTLFEPVPPPTTMTST